MFKAMQVVWYLQISSQCMTSHRFRLWNPNLMRSKNKSALVCLFLAAHKVPCVSQEAEMLSYCSYCLWSSLKMRVECCSLVTNFNCLLNTWKPERNRPLGRPRRRWEDNIKVYLREIGWEGVDWMHLAQDRDQWCAVVNTVMNLWVP
jgi:hypothetical protein